VSRPLVFATIGLGLILVGISGTAISVAFPVMTSSFDASLVQAGWILSIYQVASIIAMPLGGKASDILGNKFIFMISLSLFTIGSVLCAIVPNIQLLIFSRFIQGIGGGAYFPVTMGIVAEAFPERRQQFIGLISSIFPIGQIIGPNLGGWLVTAFGWRSVFWFNVPVGIVIFVLSAFLLKSSAREEGHIDLVGVGLLTGSIFAFLTGLSQMGNSGNSESKVSWVFSGLLLAAGVSLMSILMRRIRRANDPIIDWEVLRGKPFLAANIYNVILGACYFGIVSFVPLYAVSIYTMSTLESSLVLAPWSVGVMMAAAVTSFFLVRWGYRKPMVGGSAIVVAGLSLLAIESQGINILGVQLGSTALIVGITFLLGIGTGLALPAANNACIELMPNRVASISGVRAMFRNIGGTLSIAITALLLNNIGNMARGFTMVFFGLAAVTFITSPLIFRMPKGPGGANFA